MSEATAFMRQCIDPNGGDPPEFGKIDASAKNRIDPNGGDKPEFGKIDAQTRGTCDDA
jgi:hypothetical protein